METRRVAFQILLSIKQLLLLLAIIGVATLMSACGKVSGGLLLGGSTAPPAPVVLTPTVGQDRAPSDADTVNVIVIDVKDPLGQPLAGYTPVATVPSPATVTCYPSDSTGKAACHVSSPQAGVVPVEIISHSSADISDSNEAKQIISVQFSDPKPKMPGTIVSVAPVTVISGGVGSVSVSGAAGQVASPIVLRDEESVVRVISNLIGSWFE